MFPKMLLVLLLSHVLSGIVFADRPNVLLIMVDDMNDYTGYLGGHRQAITPNLDALAGSGVRFINAHCNAQICAPSRSSMLTGVYPHVSKNYWFDDWHKNDTLKKCKSLARFMKDNGYVAYGTGKLMHHEQTDDWTEFGIPQDPGPFPSNGKTKVGHPSIPLPFRDIGAIDGVFASLADVPHVPASGNFAGYVGWKTRMGKPFRYVSDDDRDLMSDELQANWTTEKLKELESGSHSKPFFVAVGFSRPHTPLVAPQKYFDMYPLESLKLAAIKENDRDDCHFASVFPKWDPLWTTHYQKLVDSYPTAEEGLLKHLQAYLACITFVDDQIGKVVGALDNSKLKDNTIVFLVSDHGYHQGEKQYLYKNSLWEESTRVPMIIRNPKMSQSAGKTIEHPVSLIDIYPTIADLCGLSESDNRINENGVSLGGHSLTPFLVDPNGGQWDGPDVAFSVVMTPGPNTERGLEPSFHSYSVRSKDYRYTHYVSGKEELYDHRNDPHEWTNLADNPDFADTKSSLKTQMEALTGDLDETSFIPVRTK
ncbi:arylsulfatase A-like enzyme [Rhodopirellula rubra]|uniref:Arylsulfatase A-like enzyme n=1 Tax=Aporhodopirellula rubra TaxID=980271 RepID=A0A7W5E5A2_9BACT|nr:sulfatase [Aporhodopirellula rubra]MBB3210393.1 arylsulfatase A-like enzyme [Aporhodopirellula rubra]